MKLVKSLVISLVLLISLLWVAQADTKIEGGRNAGRQPFMAKISNGGAFCSSVVWTNRIVLTALHCVKRTPVWVVLGDYDERVPDGEFTLISYEVITDIDADIAAIVLPIELGFNEYVQPINIYMSRTPATTYELYGWGRTITGTLATVLQVTGQQFHAESFANSIICTRDVNGTRASNGDSGAHW